MKLSTKIILPIILISTLLILLNGCISTVPTDESPGYTPGTITGIIASPCCSTSADPVSETCCIAPEYWCFYCQNTWNLQDGIEVVLTYGEDEVATTITNQYGEFTFTNVSPGKNYVITAYCPDFDDNRPLVKDVALELIEGGSFDTKITDLVSTSLGLVVDFLVLYTEWGPEDISLDEVLADRANFPNFPKFKKLVYEVRRVVENCEVNLLTDDDVQDALCRAAEEISGLDIGCGPGYSPPPPPPPPEPDPCDPNTAPIVNKVEYSDDGLNFTEIIEGTIIHVIKGKSYTVKADVSDDGIKDPLTFQPFLDTVGLGTYPYPGKDIGLDIPLGDWDLGTHEIKVEFYDGCTTKTWGPVTVVVHDECYENQGPWVTIADKTINAGDPLSYVIDYLDYDAGDDDVTGDPVYTLSNAPLDMVINSATGEITCTTVCGDGGVYENIKVTITDACGLDAFDTFTLTVVECDACEYLNDGPWVTIADKTINAGDPLSYVIDYLDYDAGDDDVTGDPVYTLSNAPLDMVINSATGEITCTTVCGDGGVYENIKVTITDACGLDAFDTFTLTVVECDACEYLNDGPWVTIADKTINAGDPLSYVIDYLDYDAGDDDVTGDPVYTLSNAPLDMVINSATGEITCTTVCGDGGVYENIKVTITDACGLDAFDTFTLTVVECDACEYLNDGPWVTIADKTINAGDPLSYVIDYLDYDAGDDDVTGDPVYTLSNAPLDMVINSATGEITCTTVCGDGGVYENIKVTITDACGLDAFDTFTLTVVECDACEYLNDGPWVTIADKTINAGDPLSYVIDYLDYDAGDDDVTGDPVYTLSNAPLDMVINSATGEITCTTVCGDGGVYENIKVTITDACGLDAFDTFTLTVVECGPCQLDSLAFYERKDDSLIPFTPAFSPDVYEYQEIVLPNPNPRYYFIVSADSNLTIEYKFYRGSCGGSVTEWTPVNNGTDTPASPWALPMCQNDTNVIEIRVSSATGNCEPAIYTWTSVRNP